MPQNGNGIRARWRRWWATLPPVHKKAVTAVAALLSLVVAAAAVLGGIVLWPKEEPRCAEGLTWDGKGKECYGVMTAGSDKPFIEELRAVTGQIEKQNDEVEKKASKKNPYVTIALMVPLVAGKNDRDITPTSILRDVQGAYLAQLEANRKEDRPMIRLALANAGRGMGHWREVTERLGEMSEGDDHLRAVFGFNLSTKNTQSAISELTKNRHIPVVGGPITADSLANHGRDRPYPGLAKIAPDNLEQTRAMMDHLKKKPGNLLQVVDTAANDLYTHDLREAYDKVTRNSSYEPEEFDGGVADVGDFKDIAQELCGARTEKGVVADTILYAGRVRQLSYLITALGERKCRDRPITIVSVSGASTLTTADKKAIDWKALREAKITVEYSTVAHKDSWQPAKGYKPPEKGGSKFDYERLTALLDTKEAREDKIGPNRLDDGRTITTYDSALTAIEGIRSSDDPLPSLRTVKGSWARLHGNGAVQGASGRINLRSDGTPCNKAFPIVTLDPKKENVRFKLLAWPKGSPGEACDGRADSTGN